MDKVLKEENPKCWETLFKSTYKVVRNAFHRVQLHVTFIRKSSHLTQEAKADTQ